MKDTRTSKEAIIRYENKSICIRAPYDVNFVNDLKSGTSSRRWNPEKKEWVMDISERDKALTITRRYFLLLTENEPIDKLVLEQQNELRWDKLFEIKAGDSLEVWIDGACAGNPGSGGYAVIIKNRGQVRELAGGYLLTTNNRMEIMGAIVTLESINEKCNVTIHSDSKYLVDTMTLGWAKSWQLKGWRRNKKDKAINSDLWKRLLELCAKHDVKFEWVKGHSESIENKRCDELAETMARKPGLPDDNGYRSESNNLL